MSHTVSYPPAFARFYDIIYKHLRTVDTDYFLKKIHETQGPVLEIGVGTGRFFLDALASGADIYGIDVSPEMIDVLKKNLAPEHHHRVGIADARNFTLEKQFALIVAPFRMFLHIVEVEDQLSILNRVYDHLQPHGRFIFDLFVPDPLILSQGLDNVIDFDGEYAPGKRLRRFVSSSTDIVNQLSRLTMKLEWEEEGELKQEVWETPMRIFYRYELEHLVRCSKLKLKTIHGDYNEGPLDSTSKDFIVVCHREP
ncbi:MAG: class I SAM-dependent methyltransferase [bacterium]